MTVVVVIIDLYSINTKIYIYCYCCISYGDQSWANRLRHAHFYKIVYGAGLSIAAIAWIMVTIYIQYHE
jgi:hypothetical protein